jgi:phosphate uptake regulator
MESMCTLSIDLCVAKQVSVLTKNPGVEVDRLHELLLRRCNEKIPELVRHACDCCSDIFFLVRAVFKSRPTFISALQRIGI